MAIRKMHEALTYAANAGADLSAKLNYFAHIDTDGDIVLAGDGETVAGVIYEAAAENKPVTIQFGGIGTVVAAETIAIGADIASDTNGKAVAAAATDFIVGVAVSGGDANDLISFIFLSGRVNA